MPVEAKPLFRPDVLRSHLSGFSVPTVDSARLEHWAELIASGRIDNFEEEILPDFLSDFFVAMLGYTRPAGHDRDTIGWERHIGVDGQFADAILGAFNGQQQYTVVLEGKGPRDPLDRPFAGRHISLGSSSRWIADPEHGLTTARLRFTDPPARVPPITRKSPPVPFRRSRPGIAL